MPKLASTVRMPRCTLYPIQAGTILALALTAASPAHADGPQGLGSPPMRVVTTPATLQAARMHVPAARLKWDAARQQQLQRTEVPLKAFDDKHGKAMAEAASRAGIDAGGLRALVQAFAAERDPKKRVELLTKVKDAESTLARSQGNAASPWGHDRGSLVSALGLTPSRVRPATVMGMIVRDAGGDPPTAPPASGPFRLDLSAPFLVSSAHGGGFASGDGHLKASSFVGAAGNATSSAADGGAIHVDRGPHYVQVTASLSVSDYRAAATALPGYANAGVAVQLHVLDGAVELCRAAPTTLTQVLAAGLGVSHDDGSTSSPAWCAFARDPSRASDYVVLLEVHAWAGCGGACGAAASIDARLTGISLTEVTPSAQDAARMDADNRSVEGELQRQILENDRSGRERSRF